MKNDKINTAAIQHNITQKSQAIYRSTIKQPVSQIRPFVRKVGRNMDIARSKSIAHFSPRPTPVSVKPNPSKKHFDISPSKHPMVIKAEKKRLIPADNPANETDIKASPKTAKEQLIAQAFNQLDNNQKAEKTALKHRRKIINIFGIGLVLIIIAGYFIFINLPAIYIGIACAQSGIKASYPQYIPDGYSLSDSISYRDSQVTMSFHTNTGNKMFMITESKSSWDSSAVQDKVNKDSNGMFVTTQENGLTIYTHGNNAAWVNGGILYTITGDAALSNSQVRHIATSL
jgi:hypothetical protein